MNQKNNPIPEQEDQKESIEPLSQIESESPRRVRQKLFLKNRENLEERIHQLEISPLIRTDIKSFSRRISTELKDLMDSGISEDSLSQIGQKREEELNQIAEIQDKYRKLLQERKDLLKDRLLENWGISFQGTGEDEIPLSNQGELIRKLGIKEWQINLRGRKSFNPDEIKKEILQAREKISGSEFVNLSFHGETPGIRMAEESLKF